MLCVPRATWWRCDSCEYRPRYARAGILCTRHNRHHATHGTQSTILPIQEVLSKAVKEGIDGLTDFGS